MGTVTLGQPDRHILRAMPTPTERKALLFLGVVACLGGGVRVLRARTVPPPTPDEQRAIEAQIRAQDSTRRLKAAPPKAGRGGQDSASKRKPAPVGVATAATRFPVVPAPRAPTPGNRLDLDVATTIQIQALPGIGPALAARIVANRDSNGPFGSLASLRRVRGIGPVITARIDSLVVFSGTPRTGAAAAMARSDSSALAHTRKLLKPP